VTAKRWSIPFITVVLVATALSACSTKSPKDSPPVQAEAKADDFDISKLMSEARLRPFPETGPREGFRVEAVEAASPWTQIGLRKGDVIVAVGNKPIGETGTSLDLLRAVAHPGSEPIEIIRRSGGPHGTAERFQLPHTVPK